MKNKLISNVLVVIIFVILMVTGIIVARHFGGLGKISVKEIKQPISQPTIMESYCAKAGEKTISNLNMTTGKIDPKIKVKNCCSGLKKIGDKQSITNGVSDICGQAVGSIDGICSPCGNGVCDSQYEDHCNCPEDCK